jgi:hypothetical protein
MPETWNDDYGRDHGYQADVCAHESRGAQESVVFFRHNLVKKMVRYMMHGLDGIGL